MTENLILSLFSPQLDPAQGVLTLTVTSNQILLFNCNCLAVEGLGTRLPHPIQSPSPTDSLQSTYMSILGILRNTRSNTN